MIAAGFAIVLTILTFFSTPILEKIFGNGTVEVGDNQSCKRHQPVSGRESMMIKVVKSVSGRESVMIKVVKSVSGGGPEGLGRYGGRVQPQPS